MKSQMEHLRIKQSKGFTLMELLIVVAIIAILASIAIPNFLEAQVRAKVSRAQSDLRSLTTALESYRVDNNKYPLTPIDALSSRDLRLVPLTTPTAYISALPREIFITNKTAAATGTYAYWSPGLTDGFKTAPEPNVFYYLPEE